MGETTEYSYKPYVIDTGFDAINEIMDGYIVGDMHLICVDYEDEKDKEEFLSQTLKKFIQTELPVIYISPKGVENGPEQSKTITYITTPIPVYKLDLRKQIKDLQQIKERKIIIVEDVTKINAISPGLDAKHVISPEIGFCWSVHCSFVLALEFNIPVLITIPETSFSTIKDGNGRPIEADCDVVIKLERENGQLKPIVLKNRSGRSEGGLYNYSKRKKFI